MEDDTLLPIQLEFSQDSIIKVMGVGGGGGNAINYMYRQNIQGVTYLICNTDRQVLSSSPIPAKLQLGPGLGAGGRPEQARQYAEESRDRIKEALDDGTKMLFIAAGMGGGTGTGASPVIGEVAKEMGILTVGIVTIPFAFEGRKKIEKAMLGVAELAKHMDAIIVISNEKLTKLYPNMNIKTAFSKADDVITNAAKSIAEIINVEGYINTDFADVYNTLKDGRVAIMNVGQAGGENRLPNAIRNALESPLVNSNDVHGAKRILLQLYCSQEHDILASEFDQLHEFVDQVGEDVEVQWGATYDDTLGEDVRITLIATGYTISDIPTTEPDKDQSRPSIPEAIEMNYPSDEQEKKKKEEEARIEEEARREEELRKAQEILKAEEQRKAEEAKRREAAALPTAQTAATSRMQQVKDNEFVIRFEDAEPEKQKDSVPNEQPEEKKDSQKKDLWGWMRGRR